MDRSRYAGAVVRTVILLLSVILVGGGGGLAARAESATPSTASDALLYPELRITATDTGFQLPAQVPAGRTLMTFDNGGTTVHQPVFLPLPAGETPERMQAEIQTLSETQDVAPPLWFFAGPWLGGPEAVDADGRSQAIVDLPAGHYAVIDGAVFQGQSPAAAAGFVVAPAPAATASPSSEPAADATITEREFAFLDLPVRVAPGLHTWKIANVGKQAHEFFIGKVPPGTTLDQVLALVSSPPGGTPPAEGLDFSQIASIGGLSLLGPGRTAWTVLDLTPGT